MVQIDGAVAGDAVESGGGETEVAGVHCGGVTTGATLAEFGRVPRAAGLAKVEAAIPRFADLAGPGSRSEMRLPIWVEAGGSVVCVPLPGGSDVASVAEEALVSRGVFRVPLKEQSEAQEAQMPGYLSHANLQIDRNQ